VLNKLSIMGNPNIGVYVFANDKIAIIPPGLSDYEKNILTETLNVELIETKVAGTIINGVMLAGNNKGIILPRNVLDDEYTILSKELKKHGIETIVPEEDERNEVDKIIFNELVVGVLKDESKKKTPKDY